MKKQINTPSKLLTGSIVAALVASLSVFCGMLQIEKNMLTGFELGTVWIASTTIPRGQLLTKETYEQYLTEAQMDQKLIPATALQEPWQMEEWMPTSDIEQGVVVTRGMLQTKNEITEQMREPVIAGVKAEDLYQVAGGTLRAGDRIHIYYVNEEGTAMLMWNDVFVCQVFEASGTLIENGDRVLAAQRFNIYLEKEAVERFYSELAKGSLRVVKVEG